MQLLCRLEATPEGYTFKDPHPDKDTNEEDKVYTNTMLEAIIKAHGHDFYKRLDTRNLQVVAFKYGYNEAIIYFFKLTYEGKDYIAFDSIQSIRRTDVVYKSLSDVVNVAVRRFKSMFTFCTSIGLPFTHKEIVEASKDYVRELCRLGGIPCNKLLYTEETFRLIDTEIPTVAIYKDEPDPKDSEFGFTPLYTIPGPNLSAIKELFSDNWDPENGSITLNNGIAVGYCKNRFGTWFKYNGEYYQGISDLTEKVDDYFKSYVDKYFKTIPYTFNDNYQADARVNFVGFIPQLEKMTASMGRNSVLECKIDGGNKDLYFLINMGPDSESKIIRINKDLYYEYEDKYIASHYPETRIVSLPVIYSSIYPNIVLEVDYNGEVKYVEKGSTFILYSALGLGPHLSHQQSPTLFSSMNKPKVSLKLMKEWDSLIYTKNFERGFDD